MRGKYTVQLTVAGQKFIGEADLPQAAKHNAALQVWIINNLRKFRSDSEPGVGKGQGKCLGKGSG